MRSGRPGRPIRGLRSAASLKRDRHHREGRPADADPRTQIRGLIEARLLRRGSALAALADPRTQIRGLIEAAARRRSGSVGHRDPRTQIRGLIEASWPRTSGSALSSPIRGLRSAASLKPDLERHDFYIGHTIDPRTQIRGLIEAEGAPDRAGRAAGHDPRTQIRGLIEASATSRTRIRNHRRSADSDPRPH